ncbi:glycosyltransferase family 2 protein [Candidatus Microgenomates bacterium]|nr:MAG: glycosyltransferase family 2 protein [Candidatus Microgenomates bacterium]
MRLSVVLATYNEEKSLPDCLQSVIGWCDEIVIVDGGSTDATVEIARKFTDRIFTTTNPKIFHINKQKAIDKAQGKWILQLDADEQVSKELQKEIDLVINKNEYDGFWIPRKNFFLGRFLMKGGVYPDYTLRLYKNGKGRLPQKDVHEQAVVSGSVGYLHTPLIHMADKSLARYFLRFNRYTDLIAKELKAKKTFAPLLIVNYLFIKPVYWFFWTYIRHKGFMDSWQGFLFSFFSSLRFPVGYIKFLFL